MSIGQWATDCPIGIYQYTSPYEQIRANCFSRSFAALSTCALRIKWNKTITRHTVSLNSTFYPISFTYSLEFVAHFLLSSASLTASGSVWSYTNPLRSSTRSITFSLLQHLQQSFVGFIRSITVRRIFTFSLTILLPTVTFQIALGTLLWHLLSDIRSVECSTPCKRLSSCLLFNKFDLI